MKRHAMLMTWALLSLAVAARGGTELALDQQLWLQYVDRPLPAELVFEATVDETSVGAGYLELDAIADGEVVVGVWGEVNGQARLLDCQAVGPVGRRVRLNVGAAMAAAAGEVASFKLTTRLMKASDQGGAYLRLLGAGQAAKLILVAQPLPMAGIDDPGVALPAKSYYGPAEPPAAKTPMVSVSPNPFNPQTVISLVLASAQEVTIEIYDVRGQKVKTLLKANQLSAGQHNYTWHGDLENGRRAASGVYLYRVQVGDEAFTGKMALLK